jgi:hypothetical protein
MTREEILNMQAGKKLDRLIAIHIMHLEIDSIIWETDNGEIIKQSIPNYSTDIKAAWEVVEFIGEAIGGVTIFNACDVEWTWCCEIFNGKEKILEGGKTAPEAICKAALLAVMEAQ